MTEADRPFTFIFMDLVPNAATTSLTPRTHFKYYLLCVCRFSRRPFLYGLRHLDVSGVLEGLQAFCVRFGKTSGEFGFLDIERVQADAGPQFTSPEFKQAALAAGFRLTLAAPRHQEQNAYCERTWQTVRNIAFSMMNFARVGQQYTHFALQYAVDH
ncbi:MAG: hypothetical protein ACRDL7_14870, partial [Gaiellaceae bacterium]